MEKKDNWYNKRNDRINRLLKIDSNNSKKIGIIVSNTNAEKYANQLMAITFINLMSRWCSGFSVEVNNTTKSIFGKETLTLSTFLQQLVANNDPYGNFIITENIETTQYDYLVFIGNNDSGNHPNCLVIDSYNWVYGIGSDIMNIIKPNKELTNPVGAVMAASVGVALLFKSFNEDTLFDINEKYYSLFDFTSDSEYSNLKNPIYHNSIHLGSVFQIGCGAVGSSFNYLLAYSPDITCNLNLIDYDTVEIENLATSLLFSNIDSENQVKKIDACENFIEGNPNIDVHKHDGDYSSFIKSIDYFSKDYPDIILCLANEKNVWSTIQNNLPPFVLHATTSANWGINFGRHIPFYDWCVVCRFGNTEYEHVPVCSTGKIKKANDSKEIVGALPFLSAAAAVLILAELIKKSCFMEYPMQKENFIQHSMNYNKLHDYIMLFRNRDENCPICKDHTKDSYPNHFLERIESFM